MCVNLFYNFHFVNKIFCAGKLIYNEQNITNIYGNTSLQIGVKGYVTTHCFLVAVKSQTYHLSFCIQGRRARVTSGNIQVAKETYGNSAVNSILPIVFGFI